MVNDVSTELHTFFVPQMEQLGLVEQECRHGSLSKLNAEWGAGILWAHSLGDDCLFTFHDLELNEETPLMEFPDEYICITSMTDSSARLCPIEPRYLKDRNTISFREKGGAVRFALEPHKRHRSYTFCLKLAFFEHVEGMTDTERELLVDHLSSCDANSHSRGIGRALECLDPSWATKPGGGMFCEAKLREVLACALNDAMRCAGDDNEERTSEDKRIAHEAQAIIDARFAENLTLKSLAAELYVGRTRLCSVFRKEIGPCVAEYLRARRMAEAQTLLETTDMKASETGRAVGYAHQSSFTDAFRREFGTTPSQWRDEARLR